MPRPAPFRTACEARVRHWQDRLRLTDWDIRVVVTSRGIEHAADCEAAPEYRQATLRFNPKKVPRADLDAFVVHELMHCHVWSLAAAAENLAKGDPVALEFIREREEGLTTELERLVLGLLKGE